MFETRRGTSNLSGKLILDKEPGSQTTRKESLAMLTTTGQTTCRTLEVNEEGSMIDSQLMDTETSPRLALTVQSKRKQQMDKRQSSDHFLAQSAPRMKEQEQTALQTLEDLHDWERKKIRRMRMQHNATQLLLVENKLSPLK